jgi:catechol 2,3-dioxygenase-like lactoylglutathione lyase family enzyme
MDHVGIVVDDLAAATEFFVELGLEPRGDGTVEDRWSRTSTGSATFAARRGSSSSWRSESADRSIRCRR